MFSPLRRTILFRIYNLFPGGMRIGASFSSLNFETIEFVSYQVRKKLGCHMEGASELNRRSFHSIQNPFFLFGRDRIAFPIPFR